MSKLQNPFLMSYFNLFSPLGKGQDYWEEENISEEMPSCRKMFNIFHPFDPVENRFVKTPLLE